MNWTSIVGIFAKPLGAIVNKGLAAGAAALIAWAAAKGWPMDSVTPLVSMAVLGLSTLISGFAATQGIQIPLINADDSNGVKVVPLTSPTPAVNAPIK